MAGLAISMARPINSYPPKASGWNVRQPPWRGVPSSRFRAGPCAPPSAEDSGRASPSTAGAAGLSGCLRPRPTAVSVHAPGEAVAAHGAGKLRESGAGGRRSRRRHQSSSSYRLTGCSRGAGLSNRSSRVSSDSGGSSSSSSGSRFRIHGARPGIVLRIIDIDDRPVVLDHLSRVPARPHPSAQAPAEVKARIC